MDRVEVALACVVTGRQPIPVASVLIVRLPVIPLREHVKEVVQRSGSPVRCRQLQESRDRAFVLREVENAIAADEHLVPQLVSLLHRHLLEKR